ncbi:uncharacterized protein LY89DRAFT_719470 [Mollisia scopiformis]|uniref:Uncharacterized protein n=1 Tax=Mollisia scopiformis TaxID=149040 RepID=A0A194X6E6_MOLSC|nr:uncharacterized protein LY89DRAFT_719470 [Mollisia scopiformis]KUJ15756.1 hypothetical protein LY89DRAFT_719470 [Mollisia scopiformis]
MSTLVSSGLKDGLAFYYFDHNDDPEKYTNFGALVYYHYAESADILLADLKAQQSAHPWYSLCSIVLFCYLFRKVQQKLRPPVAYPTRAAPPPPQGKDSGIDMPRQSENLPALAYIPPQQDTAVTLATRLSQSRFGISSIKDQSQEVAGKVQQIEYLLRPRQEEYREILGHYSAGVSNEFHEFLPSKRTTSKLILIKLCSFVATVVRWKCRAEKAMVLCARIRRHWLHADVLAAFASPVIFGERGLGSDRVISQVRFERDYDSHDRVFKAASWPYITGEDDKNEEPGYQQTRIA